MWQCCVMNPNLIRCFIGSSLDLECMKEDLNNRNISVCLWHTVQRVIMAACRPPWEIDSRPEKRVSVLSEPEQMLKCSDEISQWKATSMSLPVCGSFEGVMMGFCCTGRGQPAGQKEILQQHDVIKEGREWLIDLRQGRCTGILMRYLYIRNP